MKNFILIMLLGSVVCGGCRRSVHRPYDTRIPTLRIAWDNTTSCDTDCTTPDNPVYTVRYACLEPYLFMTYQPDYLAQRALPDTVPARHNPAECIDTRGLQEDIVECLQILQKNTLPELPPLKKFTVLKSRDYRPRSHTGLLVLRSRRYPFVVKIFQETPFSLSRPFARGIEECSFFVMGGGMNRFLAGFTRLKNREQILQRIQDNIYWSGRLDVPRKWYYQPPDCPRIQLEGTFVSHPTPLCSILPSTYVIIADAIEPDYTLDMSSFAQRHLAITIAEFLGLRVDPHINNFMVEKGTGTICIIDTEHFPSIIGAREPFMINDYFTYYSRLVFQFLHKRLSLTKRDRLDLQKRPATRLFDINEPW